MALRRTTVAQEVNRQPWHHDRRFMGKIAADDRDLFATALDCLHVGRTASATLSVRRGTFSAPATFVGVTLKYDHHNLARYCRRAHP